MIREPAVAGKFYPGEKRELEARLQKLLSVSAKEVVGNNNAIACIVPHAAYFYSGAVAGEVFAQLEIPSRVLILGPRHAPRGANLAINTSGSWRTPLGLAEIDSEFAAALVAEFPQLEEDAVAHRKEHSLEVELPFVQWLAPNARFVPIALGTINFDVLTALGSAIAAVISKMPERVLIVASSDMNHYETDEVTRVKDHRAIEKLLAFDPRGLYDVVRNEEITMCGVGPAIAMLTAALALGSKKSELVRYATSAEVSGDQEVVVGYAGMIFR
jgi:MEMO1 family protein